MATFELRMHRNRCSRTFNENCETSVGFSYADFLYGTDILAIGVVDL